MRTRAWRGVMMLGEQKTKVKHRRLYFDGEAWGSTSRSATASQPHPDGEKAIALLHIHIAAYIIAVVIVVVRTMARVAPTRSDPSDPFTGGDPVTQRPSGLATTGSDPGARCRSSIIVAVREISGIRRR